MLNYKCEGLFMATNYNISTGKDILDNNKIERLKEQHMNTQVDISSERNRLLMNMDEDTEDYLQSQVSSICTGK